MGPAGAQLNMMCGGLVTRHFGNGENITMTEIQSGQPVPAPCQSLTIVNASVQASRLDPANPQFVVNSLIVQIGDNSKHQAAVGGLVRWRSRPRKHERASKPRRSRDAAPPSCDQDTLRLR